MKYFADKCLMQLLVKMAETKTEGADAMQRSVVTLPGKAIFVGGEGG